MIIFPAIDIRNGHVVRLVEGRFDLETVYSDNPLEMARRWQEEGATHLHIVDLDGAKSGAPRNLKALKEIVEGTTLNVQCGGGLRSRDDVQRVLDFGVYRAVIGTKALDQKALSKLTHDYADKLAVSLDVREHVIQTHGWQTANRSLSILEFCRMIAAAGVHTVIYTDISRDGKLGGPNLEGLRELLSQTHLDIIASGGISSNADLDLLLAMPERNLKGIIIGKALYEGKIRLTQALAKSRQSEPTE